MNSDPNSQSESISSAPATQAAPMTQTAPGTAAPVHSSFQEDAGEADLLAYGQILLSYWWILAPLAVLGAAAGMAFCYYIPPRYRAVCRFEIFENQMLSVTNMPDERNERVIRGENPLDRQIILLEGENLNADVLDQLCSEWQLGEPGEVFHSEPKITIEPVKGASDHIMDISVDSMDGRFSREYIELLLEKHKELLDEETAQIHSDTIKNLREEEEKLDAELADLRSQLVEFETEHNLTFTKQKRESELAHLADTLQRQREIRSQRTILESQFPFLKNADVVTLTDVLDLTSLSIRNAERTQNSAKGISGDWSKIPEWQDMEAQIIRMEAEYEHLRETYKPLHPNLVELQDKIDLTKRELETAAELALKRMQSRRDALSMQEDALLEVAKNQRIDLEGAEEDLATGEKFKARIDRLTSLHEKVYGRLMDASSESRQKYFSRIIEGPLIKPGAVWPSKPLMVALGMFSTSGLGGVLILLLFLRKMRLYSLEAVEVGMNIPCVASVPKTAANALEKNPFFINDLSKASVLCEAYRSLRIALEKPGTDPRVVLVTSPGPGEGKTFTAVNLANVFSWSDSKVLLIDGDLRRTSLRKMLVDLPKEHKGLIDCLKENRTDWKQYVVRDLGEGVDYLPAGHSTESGAELLSRPIFERILSQTREEYDLVILDSAPVAHVTETMLLAQHVDSVLLVARLGKTSMHAMHYAIDRLKSCNLIGFVQNCVTGSVRKYGYYGGYGGYYKKYGYNRGYYHGYYRGYYPSDYPADS